MVASVVPCSIRNLPAVLGKSRQIGIAGGESLRLWKQIAGILSTRRGVEGEHVEVVVPGQKITHHSIADDVVVRVQEKLWRVLRVMEKPHGAGEVRARKHVETRHILHPVPPWLIGFLFGGEGLDSFEFLGCEAVFPLASRGTEQRRGIEVTGGDVPDDAVPQAVQPIARLHHRFAQATWSSILPGSHLLRRWPARRERTADQVLSDPIRRRHPRLHRSPQASAVRRSMPRGLQLSRPEKTFSMAASRTNAP